MQAYEVAEGSLVGDGVQIYALARACRIFRCPYYKLAAFAEHVGIAALFEGVEVSFQFAVCLRLLCGIVAYDDVVENYVVILQLGYGLNAVAEAEAR